MVPNERMSLAVLACTICALGIFVDLAEGL